LSGSRKAEGKNENRSRRRGFFTLCLFTFAFILSILFESALGITKVGFVSLFFIVAKRQPSVTNSAARNRRRRLLPGAPLFLISTFRH
jgi:hypothetical protein